MLDNIRSGTCPETPRVLIVNIGQTDGQHIYCETMDIITLDCVIINLSPLFVSVNSKLFVLLYYSSSSGNYQFITVYDLIFIK